MLSIYIQPTATYILIKYLYEERDYFEWFALTDLNGYLLTDPIYYR